MFDGRARLGLGTLVVDASGDLDYTREASRPRRISVARPKQLGPYGNFKFQVTIDGRIVAGFNKVGALTRRSVVASGHGDTPRSLRTSPGQVDYGPITLERGLTEHVEFNAWANRVWDYPNSSQLGREVSVSDFRKDVRISLLNEAGQAVMAWNVYKSWVSEYTAVPDLDASGDAVAISSMTLQHEGWVRDSSFKSPDEPGSDEPGS
jgi:phage tail-like protein